MILNIDKYNYFQIIENIFNNSNHSTVLFNSLLIDLNCFLDILVNATYSANRFTNVLKMYNIYYLDIVYNQLIINNVGFYKFTITNTNLINIQYYCILLFLFFFKINLFIYIILTIYIITNFENYIKQTKTISLLMRLFILNNTEKEVGPVDDYFFFAILFTLTISIFVFTAIILILIQSNIFIWAVGGFFLLTILILSIPVNLFIDFGINYCVSIRGAGQGNNLIKELLLDIIATTIVFIRFVIQNIRFIFIFFGIFELLEWTISTNNSLFLSSIYNSNNLFFLNQVNTQLMYTGSFNFLMVNTILSLILYLYYFLHLLFLLLVQVTIYIGITIWLFFSYTLQDFQLNLINFLFFLKNNLIDIFKY